MVKLAPEDRRSAALLFSAELVAGTAHVEQLDDRLVVEAVTSHRVPTRLSRMLQERAVRRGRLSYEGDTVAAFVAARRGVLGSGAEGPPRFLIRVDGHAAPVEAVRRCHRALVERALPHLVSVAHPVDSDRLDLLSLVRRNGGSFALYVGANVGAALEALAEHAIRPRVAVAPPPRLGWREWRDLAPAFDVVTSGPDSVRRMGWHHSPMFLGGAVWMPCPAELCGSPADVLATVERLVAQRTALWTPLAIDASRDADDPALEPLLDALAGCAASWDEFLDAVELARRIGEVTAA